MTGNGISYTTKELIENLTRRVSELEQHGSRQAVEAAKDIEILKTKVEARERAAAGYEHLIEEHRKLVARWPETETRIQRLENGIGEKILEAIRANNKELTAQKEAMFSKREKLIAVGFAAVGAIGTIVSVVVLLLQVAGGPPPVP